MADDTDRSEPASTKKGRAPRSKQREAGTGQPALPGEKCRTDPHASWSEAEAWAWGEICAGRIADFNRLYKLDKPLDPNKPDGWGDKAKNRRLSPAFLEAVLLYEPWRSATPYKGVRIAGGLFPDPLDLSSAHLNRQLWLDDCRFDAMFTARDLHIDGWLSLEGSSIPAIDLSGSDLRAMNLERATVGGEVVLNSGKVSGLLSMGGSTLEGDVRLTGAKVGVLNFDAATFEGAVEMDGLEVASSLLMSDKVTFKGNLALRGAKVGGQLSMIGSTFEGAVEMDGLEVAGDLLMREEAIFKSGVALRGAKIGRQFSMTASTFYGTTDMDSLEVAQSLLMSEKATFKAGVVLRSAKIGGQLAMEGSTFEGAVEMDSLEVASSLFMRDKATFKADVVLRGAKVGGQLSMIDSTFEGAVKMDSLGVAQSLLMSGKATFKANVELRGAKIGGQLAMNGSTFEGAINMDGLEAAGSLHMGAEATFKSNVRLSSAKIGGQLAMEGSSFEGSMIMDSLEVASSLFIRDARCSRGGLSLIFAKVGGNADLSGTAIARLDLTGTEIVGELRMGTEDHARTRWPEGGGRLILRNTHVGAVQDRIDQDGEQEKDAWPAEMQLDGFTYGRLGGLAGRGEAADMIRRGSRWFIENWLVRDRTYSPQPYEQLASVFRAAGHTAKAHDILYASRERERWEASGFWKFLGLSLLNWTIGYGLGVRYFKALAWVSAFVVIGAAFLWAASYLPGNIPNNGVLWNLSCSLDLLLPIIELNPVHSTFVMETLSGSAAGWMIYYFYFHKLVGWLLASFLIAGLAGLTQK